MGHCCVSSSAAAAAAAAAVAAAWWHLPCCSCIGPLPIVDVVTKRIASWCYYGDGYELYHWGGFLWGGGGLGRHYPSSGLQGTAFSSLLQSVILGLCPQRTLIEECLGHLSCFWEPYNPHTEGTREFSLKGGGGRGVYYYVENHIPTCRKSNIVS